MKGRYAHKGVHLPTNESQKIMDGVGHNFLAVPLPEQQRVVRAAGGLRVSQVLRIPVRVVPRVLYETTNAEASKT